MYEASEILRLFEARMHELGMTQVELGLRAFGKADNAAIQGLKRGSVPALDRVAAMAKALDLEVYLGPRRGDTGPIEHVILEGADYARIALHDAFLSAGAGIVNGGGNIVDHLAFRRDWLKRLGVDPTQACLARVSGDSMFPTLSSGDMVLIDTAHQAPLIRQRDDKDKRRSPIYAFIESGEARIKRIERPDQNVILLLSDNPDYAPQLRSGEQILASKLSIIGKVVWAGHTIHD